MSAALNYEISRKNVLGKGSFATVYRGRHRSSGTVVALKRVECETNSQLENTLLREVELMQQCACKYIVKLFDSFRHGKYFWLVLEVRRVGIVVNFLLTLNKLSSVRVAH